MSFKRSLIAALTASTSSLAWNIPFGSSFGAPGDNATYDYLVVGGGTAGLTLATRLIEQNVGSVAVVEAGSFYEITNSNFSEIPATGSFFSGKAEDDWQPLIDWGYHTTPQEGGLGQSIHYARGKTFGGSSARNYMVYQRATEGVHQQWADLTGDDDYNWQNFLPWYKKSVNFTGPDTEYRNANSTPTFITADIADEQPGHLSVTWPKYAQAFGSWSLKAFEQVGMPIIDGFLSGRLIGLSWATFTINADTMQRESSETAFLRATLGNPNYYLHPRAMVKKLLFDESKKATGILVDTEGVEYVLSARKEIILTAGVFGSPQILMASGVGPADQLEALNIPVVADRPGVGQNMQDHIYYGLSYRVNAPTVSSLNDPAFAAEQLELYHEHSAGMYSSPLSDAIGWEKIPTELRQGWDNKTNGALNAIAEDWPEVEYIGISALLGNMRKPRHGDPKDGYNYATIAASLVAPQSRGNLTLISGDTSDAPLINPAYLTHPADINVAVASVKRIRQMFATDALKPHLIGEEYFPGPSVESDEDIETFIRTHFHTIWHAACTCVMGPVSNPLSVVDNKGRVIGIEGVRVADAAAFPALVPGHLMSTVYALAEKIACDVAGNCE